MILLIEESTYGAGMLLTMTTKELKKLEIIQSVCDKRIRQIDAVKLLHLSHRHIQRLVNQYRHFGADGLVSKKRAAPSNRQFSSILKSQVTGLIKKHYFDFGPTLATEKLSKIHHLNLSVETVRKWMISASLWKPRVKKSARFINQEHEEIAWANLFRLVVHLMIGSKAEPIIAHCSFLLMMQLVSLRTYIFVNLNQHFHIWLLRNRTSKNMVNPLRFIRINMAFSA